MEASFMLSTIAIILLVLWVLGLGSSTTIGGVVHVLPAAALIIVGLRVIQGRRAVGA
ncbi:MAG: lmo0937 family membrane protein [Acidobacteriota bacterium]